MGADNFEPNYIEVEINGNKLSDLPEYPTISLNTDGYTSIDYHKMIEMKARNYQIQAGFMFDKATAQKIYDDFASIIYRARGLVADGATITKVIFNEPATVVYWSDDTKTVVKCQEGDKYEPEHGLAMCIAKKCCGNRGYFNEVFKKWLPKE